MPNQQYGGMAQQQQNYGFGAPQNFGINSASQNNGFDNGNFDNGNFSNQQGFGNNFWQVGAETWNSEITNNTLVDNYSHVPIPIHSKQPTMPTTSDYIYALQSLAKNPQLPKPTYGGEKLRKTYGFAANVLLSTVSINMQNVREWASLDSGATSHLSVS